MLEAGDIARNSKSEDPVLMLKVSIISKIYSKTSIKLCW